MYQKQKTKQMSLQYIIRESTIRDIFKQKGQICAICTFNRQFFINEKVRSEGILISGPIVATKAA